jgi:hypothetical protein
MVYTAKACRRLAQWWDGIAVDYLSAVQVRRPPADRYILNQLYRRATVQAAEYRRMAVVCDRHEGKATRSVRGHGVALNRGR